MQEDSKISQKEPDNQQAILLLRKNYRLIIIR